MKTFLTILAIFSLSGCASLDTKFLENRVVCTVAKDEAHVVSKWGPVGIAAKIAEADTKVICK